MKVNKNEYIPEVGDPVIVFGGAPGKREFKISGFRKTERGNWRLKITPFWGDQSKEYEILFVRLFWNKQYKTWFYGLDEVHSLYAYPASSTNF